MTRAAPNTNHRQLIRSRKRHTPSVVLIDGRSGAGKTALATAMAEELGAEVLHLEDLYPGWDGLAEGAKSVAGALTTGQYIRYDWHAEAFAEQHRLNLSVPLIIEGCGAISHANLAAAQDAARSADCAGTVESIWIDCPEPVRRKRALSRDGQMFAPYWNRWARQEDAHIERERPRELADIIYSDPLCEATAVAGES